PEPVQQTIASGALSEKHGRALRRIEEPELQGKVADAVVAYRLTGEETATLVGVVRTSAGAEADVESLARQAKSGEFGGRKKGGSANPAEAVRPTATQGDPLEETLKRLDEEISRLEGAVLAVQDPEVKRALIRHLEKLAKRVLRLALTVAGEPPGEGNPIQ
ncbi:MAG: hypothetical protein KY468_13830, partial [Armatimonadetes bacterium]|nr:hypothetical protein [Armatimonadota bacterium]